MATQAIDFSDLGAQQIPITAQPTTAQPSAPLDFSDLGAKPIQPAVQPNTQSKAPLDFSGLGAKPAVTPQVPAAGLDFSDLGAKSAGSLEAVLPAVGAALDSDQSTWQRIKGFAQHPLVAAETAFPELVIPGLAGKAAADYLENSGHPTLAKVAGSYSGAENAVKDMVSGMTSPLNVAIMVLSSGFGSIADAAPLLTKLSDVPVVGKMIPAAVKAVPTVSRLVNAGFSVGSIYNAYESYPDIKQAIESGDTALAAKLITSQVGNVGMAAMTGLHALGSVHVPVEATEGKEAPEPLTKAPLAKIVDTEAQKAQAESEGQPAVQTVPPVKLFHGTSGDLIDVSEMKPEEFGKPGSLGVGAYFSTEPAVAGKYAGPDNVAIGGRVIAGELQPGTKILDADATLPDGLQKSLTDRFGDQGKTYSDYVKNIVAGQNVETAKADLTDLQKFVAQDGYKGAQSENVHGAHGLMLFGEDVTGTPLKDVIKPTLPTARIVPDAHVPVVSRDQITSEAAQREIENSPVIQRMVDPAEIQTPKDIQDALENVAAHIRLNIDGRTGVVITLPEQQQLAADLNMPVEELLNRKPGAAFNAEHAIAARTLLASSVDNVVGLAKQAALAPDNEQAQKDFASALARHNEVLTQVKGVTSEAGRALGSFRADTSLPQTRIAKALAGLKPEVLSQAADLVSRLDPNDPAYVSKVNKFIEQVTPSTTGKKLFEVYRNMLLSGPATVIKKSASEAAMMTLETMKKTAVGGLEQLKSATGATDETPEATASEGYWFAKGAAQSLTHIGEVLRGEFNLNGAGGFEGNRTEAIKGTTGEIIRLPSKLIERLTNAVYLANYMGELNSLAGRQAVSEGLTGEDAASRQDYLAHNPTPEMQKAANLMGLHGTFQDKLGKTGQSANQVIQSNGALKALFPFFKTPVNLIKASGEYSPYGVLKGTYQGDLNLQTKGLVGSSILASLAYLSLEGHITGGGPVNYAQRQTKEATGWQPYSVKIGGKYYSYNRLEPLGLTLSSVADAVHGILLGDEESVTGSKVLNALGHVTRNIESIPFLMQVGNIIDSLTHLGSGDTTERVVDNLLASMVVPAAVKDVAQGMDTTKRSPTREGFSNLATGLGQTIEERTPAMTRRVPAQIDIAGQPQHAPASGLGGANPFPWTTDQNNHVTEELARLGLTVEQMPKPVTRKLHNGKTVVVPGGDMTLPEAQELQRQETAETYNRWSKAISSPGWQSRTMTDELRKSALEKIHEQVVKGRLQRLQQIKREEQ
jgi:hypothetical protein